MLVEAALVVAGLTLVDELMTTQDRIGGALVKLERLNLAFPASDQAALSSESV